MGPLRLIEVAGVGPLRGAAAAWDDLWQRSDATAPLLRAELVAQWVEQFSPQGGLRALAVVEEQGRWLAALPLVPAPDGGVLRTGRLASNDWSCSGDLLLDSAVPAAPVLDLLVRGMRTLPWRMLWLNQIAVDAPRWRALGEALDRAGMVSDSYGHTRYGMIPTGGDWDAYCRGLSKKDRVKMERCGRRLAEQGEVRLDVYTRVGADGVEGLLRRAFEVEDRSWKGRAGTSVLRSPGMLGFFTRQARQLAAWGQLELAFLECGGKPVAFSYGHAAKGVSCWHKIGYDPGFGCCSPGQLLQWRLLQWLHAGAAHRAVDTAGPLTDALGMWNPAPYRLGRLIIATRGLMGRLLLSVGKRALPLARRVRRLARARRGPPARGPSGSTVGETR